MGLVGLPSGSVTTSAAPLATARRHLAAWRLGGDALSGLCKKGAIGGLYTQNGLLQFSHVGRWERTKSASQMAWGHAYSVANISS